MLIPVRQGLFEQLGGFDPVERATAAFFARLAADPACATLVPAARVPEAQWQLQLLLTELTGGPMAYDGPDLERLREKSGIDGPLGAQLIEHLLAAFAAGGVPTVQLAVLREVVVEFARVVGVTSMPAAARSGGAGAILVRRAEAQVAAAGLSDWSLFVLDADLVLVHQNPAATVALAAAAEDMRRAFGVSVTDLLGQSMLRFHPAPTQLQGWLHDAERLPRDVTWSFGRITWRVQLFHLPGPSGRADGFALAWRDDSAAHRRDTIIARLRAQAEELPVPVMFPEGSGERWFGNAACEHALERLAPWLPPGFNPSNGIPGALFFPDAAERASLFAGGEWLPLKKRMPFGPEVVSLLVSAVCDDDRQLLCPQITWEIVHSIAPLVEAPVAPVMLVANPVAVPVAAHGAGLQQASVALRQEARAVEASARALVMFMEILDALADQAAATESAETVALVTGSAEGSDAATLLAEQGIAALAAAREIAGDADREAAVIAALDRLMAVARRANHLVVDASLRMVEEGVASRIEGLLGRSAAVRAGVDAPAAVLAQQAQEIGPQLARAIGSASRLNELRDSLAGGAGSPVASSAPEAPDGQAEPVAMRASVT